MQLRNELGCEHVLGQPGIDATTAAATALIVEQDTTLTLGEGSTILSAVRRIVATLQRDSAALTARNNEL